jgi:DNA-binding MarR family transcriptional regulator
MSSGPRAGTSTCEADVTPADVSLESLDISPQMCSQGNSFLCYAFMPIRSHTSALSEQAEIDRLRVVLLRLARRIRNSTDGDVTPSQRVVLASIVHHGELTVGQIADLEHVKPPSASKIVAALEQRGFVERRSDPHDRRCVPIAATTEGVAFLESARAAGRTWLAGRLGGLDAADVDAIEQALPALERLLGVVE